MRRFIGGTTLSVIGLRTDVAREVVLEGGRQRASAARHVGRGGELGLLVDVGSRSQAGFLGSLQQCPLSKAPAVGSHKTLFNCQ